MNRSKISLIVLSLFATFFVHAQAMEKPNRVVVLTDIEADPDDAQSLIRLLLYANEIDIKGLVATTSTHMKDQIHPESIKKIINAYGKVVGNLNLHATGYPGENSMLSLIKSGLPIYGMQGVGNGKDSEGSDWIIKVLEEDDGRPLWISVWGGVNTLAQALHKIRSKKSSEEARRLISKLRVYTISDQDDSGIWIRRNFPELFYIVSPGGYFGSTWIAIATPIEGIDNETVSNPWLAKNIQQGHGPLGAMYPDIGYGMEGDTPAFLSLIPNGLNSPDNPSWGDWGGRYEYYRPTFASLDQGFTGGVPIEEQPREIWTTATDMYQPYLSKEYGRPVIKDTTVFEDNRVTIWRWRDEFQNDFAARMDWCLSSFEVANHPPQPALGHSENLTVTSGERFYLSALGTSDPDGDNLSYLWFNYPEAGSLDEAIPIENAENLYKVPVVAPEVDQTETAHFILKVTDKGTPALTRYKRVVVAIKPK